MHPRFKLILFAALAFGCGIGLGLLPPPTYQAQGKKVAQKPPPKVAAHPQHTKSTGYVPLTPERRAAIALADRGKHGQHIKQAAKNLVLPAAYDVRVKSPLPIGDQGPCGSCYLYSTVRTMTDAGVMVGLGKPNGSFALSVQYGMDSPRNFGGCDGGNGTEVIAWAVQHGWIAEKWVDAAGVAHTDYPAYEARSGRDRTAPGAKVWAQGWTWGLVSNSGRASTADVKAAMFLYGRLNVALDAGGQFGNGTNTITQLGSQINHEINMVAWDDNKDGGAFLLENQWGPNWGTNGCRWVTYSAAQNIVDQFWVSAGTIPPPPPPPVPPDPGPGPAPTPGSVTSVVITFADGTSQTLTQQRAATSIIYSDGTTQPIVQPKKP